MAAVNSVAQGCTASARLRVTRNTGVQARRPVQCAAKASRDVSRPQAGERTAQALAAAFAAAQLMLTGPAFAAESGVQPIQSPEGSGTEFTTGDQTRSDIPVANMPPGKSISNLGQAAGDRVSETRGGGQLPGQGAFDVGKKLSSGADKAAQGAKAATPKLGDLSEGLPGSNVSRSDSPSGPKPGNPGQVNAGNLGGGSNPLDKLSGSVSKAGDKISSVAPLTFNPKEDAKKAANAVKRNAPGVIMGDLSDSDLRGSQTTGAEKGATRTNIPGLGEIKGPSPKSDAFAGGNRADFSPLNPLSGAGDVKSAVGKAASNAADKAGSAGDAVKNLSRNALE